MKYITNTVRVIVGMIFAIPAMTGIWMMVEFYQPVQDISEISHVYWGGIFMAAFFGAIAIRAFANWK